VRVKYVKALRIPLNGFLNNFTVRSQVSKRTQNRKRNSFIKENMTHTLHYKSLKPYYGFM